MDYGAFLQTSNTSSLQGISWPKKNFILIYETFFNCLYLTVLKFIFGQKFENKKIEKVGIEYTVFHIVVRACSTNFMVNA